MSEDNTQPEVEETPQPFDIEEPTDDLLSDRIDAYIAERKAAQESGEEEGEGEEESDCPDGDCDEAEEDDSDLEALAARAAEVGLDEEDIAKIGNVENLERMVMILEARKKSQEEPQPEPEKVDPDFADVPEELKPALEQVTKAYEDRIAALESQLGEYGKYADMQAEKAVKNEFDGFVADLGPEYESLFGTGSSDNLRNGSKELSNRVTVLEEMNALAKGYEAVGREVPDEKSLFSKALSSVFGEEIIELKAAAKESQIAERRSKFVGRPSQRHGKQKSPEAAAIASVRQYMEEAGIGLGAEE
tara:strand:+ start:64 stop:975 length:912 start_codon:yes stop_codon:yes gene_type:complete